MGIFERLTNIVRSNINDLLDNCEDPAKQIEQTIRDLRRDLAEVKVETAKVMADEKNAQAKVEECKKEVAQYAEAARNALIAGNDEDAKRLIAKKQKMETTLASLQETYEVAKANAAEMRQAYDKLTNDIEDLEARRDAIKAKVATANAQKRINKIVAGTTDSSASIEAFESMEDKADKMLNAARAEAELNEGAGATEDLVQKYTSNTTASVEDELAAMKASLNL